MTRPSLDQIRADADEWKRRHQQDEAIRQMSAEMADEIRRIEAEDWKAPDDVDAYTPETPAPADWWVREQIAKSQARGHLAEEPKEPDSAGYSIFVEDTD